MKLQKLYDNARFEELRTHQNASIYKLAAHVFVGDHQKARWLAEKVKPQNNRDLAFIQFHLGLSMTRTSQYKKAAKYFKNNIELAHQIKDNAEIQFLAYQGLGFFNFFFSRHRQSLQAVDYAHRALEDIDNSQLRHLYYVLCLDLEGHNLIHRYRIHQGLSTLEEAYQLTKKFNIVSFKQSLEFSILLYRSRFLQSPLKAYNELMDAFNNLSPTDDYSRSELVFEISNILMLLGEYRKAQDFLASNYKVIYQTENKRQMGQLNFRMTYNMFRQGDFEQALYLAKTARHNLNKLTDKGLICKILGLELKILNAMGEPTQDASSELRSFDNKVDSLFIKRSNTRHLQTRVPVNKGEDWVGDIVERLHFDSSPKLYKEIVKSSLNGLLIDFFKLPPGQIAIALGAPLNQTVVYNGKKVFAIEKPLGKILTLLIQKMASKPQRKEDLIQKVWGYGDYSPLRHDSLIYSAIARLRNLLEFNEQQLSFNGESYQLNAYVLNYQDKGSTGKINVEKNLPKEELFLDNLNPELNYRQLKILSTRHNEALSVKFYADKFQITTMTALRDMQKLCEFGYLKKVGRGRATRYIKIMISEC